MTGGAPRVEEPLARLRVADDDIRRAQARLVVTGRAERKDERRDAGNLIVGQRELRHPAIDAAVLHDRSDQLTGPILEDDLRPQQTGSAVTAAGVGAMAERAVHAVERPAAL